MKGRLKDLAKRTVVILVAVLMIATGMFTGGVQEARAETASASDSDNFFTIDGMLHIASIGSNPFLTKPVNLMTLVRLTNLCGIHI